MDGVDPALVDQAEQTLRAVPGVLDVGQVRLRWIGHQLRAECEIVIDPGATDVQSHQLTVSAKHALLHAVHRQSAPLVPAVPPHSHGAASTAVPAPHRLPRYTLTL